MAKCFAELKKLGVASSDEPAEKSKEKLTLKGVGNAILDYISGSMSFSLEAYTFAVPSPLSLPQFISESSGSNFTHALIVTALITWFTTDP